MIGLFKVKEKQREQAQNASRGGGGGASVKKQSAGELRLHKDISELNLPSSCKISFPNGKDDLMNFEVSIKPDDGYYHNGTFAFTFQVSPVYPHEVPKVKCKTKVYHPNIDLEGNVCLNILREDWKPVLNINTVIYGLFHLFTEPNSEDPLNHDAAQVLRDNPKLFETNVRRAMTGGSIWFARFLSLSPAKSPNRTAIIDKTHHWQGHLLHAQGNVCLNILREDWKPVLNINTVIYGLFHLFTEPNSEDPLNHDAAQVLRDNPKLFETNVRRAMTGGYVGQTFSRAVSNKSSGSSSPS